MNKKWSTRPDILVLYNRKIINVPDFNFLKNLQVQYSFCSFSEFTQFESLPENTFAIFLADFPNEKLLHTIKLLIHGFHACIAICKNEDEISKYSGEGINRWIILSDTEKNKLDKIYLYFEILQKEKEIKELSDFIEVGHMKCRDHSTKIKLLSSTVNEPILIVNQDKKITLWNREAQNKFGYSKFEVVHENFFQCIISDKSYNQIDTLFSEVISGEKKNIKTNKNIIVRNKIGLEFEINVSISTHRKRGKEHYFVFVFHDIQKAKKLEREIIKSRELWEETKILKEFVHHVTHEIRTPMNSIIGIAKAIEKYNSENLSERQKEGLQIIISSGNQLVALIKDLLDIARMDKNKVELNNEFFNPDKLLSLQKSQIFQLLEDKPVKFIIRKSPTVPESLYGDHRKIYQILTNLIGNAVKFTNEGKIVLSCHFFENKLFFEILDTGIGIRPEKQKEIFEKFTQADVSFSSIGTGLGLHISKKLIQLMHGEISIESEFEKGTLVRFYVNLAEAPVKSESKNDKGYNDNNKRLSIKPNRKLILAIDDSQQNSFIYRLLAENNYFNVLQVKKGKEGLDAIKTLRPDLIILKIEIPEIHGSTIIKAIKNYTPEANIITLSEMNPKFDLPGVRYSLQDPLSYDSVLKIISEITAWPEKKYYDTVIIYDKKSWIRNIVQNNGNYHFILNKNPEHAVLQLYQIRTRKLIIEDLSTSSNALNLVLRILSKDEYEQINEIILHNEGVSLKLVKDKIKSLKQVKMLSSEEIQELYLK